MQNVENNRYDLIQSAIKSLLDLAHLYSLNLFEQLGT